MKEFLKKLPDKISLYTTIYMVAFTVFSLLNGTDSIPTVKLLQGLFIGALPACHPNIPTCFLTSQCWISFSQSLLLSS